MIPTFIGNHPGAGHPNHLHKEEVFALLLSAGRASGFTVHVEHPAGTGRIDCCWLDGDTVIAVFEVDGRDVHSPSYRGTLVGNAAKFLASQAGLRFQILYSLKNNLRPKPSAPDDDARVRALLPANVVVLLDEVLLGPAPSPATLPTMVHQVAAQARQAASFPM
jgi:hypothetical protein